MPMLKERGEANGTMSKYLSMQQEAGVSEQVSTPVDPPFEDINNF